METKKQYFPTMLMVLCLAFLVVARGAGIINSFFATDVMYENSILIYILPMLRHTFTAMSFAAAAVAAFMCIQHQRKFTAVVWLYAGMLLLDMIALILYDFFNGVLEGRLLFAIVYRLGLLLYSVILLLIGTGIASFIINKKKSPVLAAITSAALSAAIDLISVLWSCVDSLIEWEFLPLASEIRSMLWDTGTVILAFAMSVVVALIFVKPAKSKKLT